MSRPLVPVDGPLHAEVGGIVGAPRLVFVHGFTQTGRSWWPLAERFADRYEIMLIDAPGHGGSSTVHAGLVESGHLIGEMGGHATYLGYSMGARMVLHLAVDSPHLIDRLVLVSATGGIDDANERAARRASDEALAVDLERYGLDAFLERWLALPLFARLSAEAADPDDRRRNSVDGLASSLRLAGTGTQEPLWERLPSIEAPTLVIAGEHDVKFTDLGRRLADALGPQTSLTVIADAGHAAHLERPGDVQSAIERFLGSTLTGR